MAMMHLIGAIKTKYMPELRVEVLNFNHNLRPAASAEEKLTVEKWAEHYKFPFHAVKRDEDEAFGETGVQEAARAWRQEVSKTLLEQYRKRNQRDSMIAEITAGKNNSSGSSGEAVAVAVTGHHLEDQVETMVMKMMRGVHISRMHPMLPCSPCGNFIKPLLGVSKENLHHYMRENGYPWHEDASNTDTKYKRNEARLQVVPALAGLAGGKEALHRRFKSMAEQSLELRRWLEGSSRAFILEHVVSTYDRHEDVYFPVAPFLTLPPPVQLEIIHFLVSQSTGGHTLDYDQCKKVAAIATDPVRDGARSRTVQITDSWVVTKIGDVVRLQDTKYVAALKAAQTTTNFAGGQVTVTHPAGVMLQVTIAVPDGNGNGNDDNDDNDDCDGGVTGAVGGAAARCLRLCNVPIPRKGPLELQLRYAESEDRFGVATAPNDSSRSGGGDGGKKMAEFLRGAKVPLHERERVQVVALLSQKEGSGFGSGGGVVLGAYLPPELGGAVAAPGYNKQQQQRQRQRQQQQQRGDDIPQYQQEEQGVVVNIEILL
jgi:tRNA(Ile)-lysidine synthase